MVFAPIRNFFFRKLSNEISEETFKLGKEHSHNWLVTWTRCMSMSTGSWFYHCCSGLAEFSHASIWIFGKKYFLIQKVIRKTYFDISGHVWRSLKYIPNGKKNCQWFNISLDSTGGGKSFHQVIIKRLVIKLFCHCETAS